jgi:hypothetical protein
MTVTTEAVLTARDYRKQAQEDLRKAARRVYGKSGLSKAEKVERLRVAADFAHEAAVALIKAAELAEAAVALIKAAELAEAAEENDGQIVVIETIEQPTADMDADELEAYQASF